MSPVTPDEIFQKTDKELVALVQVTDLNNHTREIAKAEQIRRQTDAIRAFDEASNRWSKHLFWLTVMIAVLTDLMLLDPLGRLLRDTLIAF